MRAALRLGKNKQTGNDLNVDAIKGLKRGITFWSAALRIVQARCDTVWADTGFITG